MKKNGFTLIELLAVLVILAILAIITTVTVSNILDDSKGRLSERQKRNIEDAAETYYLKENGLEVETIKYILTTYKEPEINNQRDKARLEKLKLEKEELSNQKQENISNKEKEEQAYRDKDLYLSLICEGDTLLNNNKFADAISKYKQAETYRDKYLYTEYSGLFNISTYNKITAVDDAEKKYKEKQAREAKYRRTHGTINGHEWVDLGLPTGVKWATCNIGADKPENYGNYYAWGEINPNSYYTSSNCATYGKHMGDISGDVQFDAARANWKGSWRLPTQGELEELKNNCKWNWTTQNGIWGYEVKGHNGNSIFLPCTGYRAGLLLHEVGEFGYYWSSTPDNYRTYEWESRAYSLCVYRSNGHKIGVEVDNDRRYRDYGLTIRPVTD